MTNTWLYADPHFGHYGTAVEFLRADGSKLRPFTSVAEQDETLIANYNALVGDKDRVYILGDLLMKPWAIQSVERLKGRKVLIKGNHDNQKLNKYLPHFDDIRSFHKLDSIVEGVRRSFVMTHIPIHPDCMDRWDCNIHGHLHQHRIMQRQRTMSYFNGEVTEFKHEWVDPRFLCVSVEHTDYKPISFDDAVKRWVAQQ